MKILVTGAHGFLGRSVLRQDVAEVELVACGRRGEPPPATLAYRRVNLLDTAAVTRLLALERPDWVIHTAALTDVDLCETERDLARRVNLEMVGNLADGCGEIDAGLAHLSTDYVFDGRSGPYAEEDPTNPLSYYGQVKLESEARVLESGIRGLVLRTLWLFGYVPETRRNLVTWPLEALVKGEELAIAHDQWGNPAFVGDVALSLVELCLRGSTGLFHVGGADYMTRHELVQELARFFGLDAGRVRAVPTEHVGQKAKRPLRSGLRWEHLAAKLGREPMGFAQGLAAMKKEQDFRRDFADLA